VLEQFRTSWNDSLVPEVRSESMSTDARDAVDPLLGGRPAVDVDALYRAHAERLRRLAAAVVLERQLAEEIVHDAFVGLQQHRQRVDDPLAYLQRSVVNQGIKRQRRRRTASRYVWPSAGPNDLPEIDETWQVVVRLPAAQRAVVALRFWHDLSIDEIAHLLGRPSGSIKSTLHRALRRLQEELR
jgi:DNA-directed RNA polymerase specialized sigma24 family protein